MYTSDSAISSGEAPPASSPIASPARGGFWEPAIPLQSARTNYGLCRVSPFYVGALRWRRARTTPEMPVVLSAARSAWKPQLETRPHGATLARVEDSRTAHAGCW